METNILVLNLVSMSIELLKMNYIVYPLYGYLHETFFRNLQMSHQMIETTKNVKLSPFYITYKNYMSISGIVNIMNHD